MLDLEEELKWLSQRPNADEALKHRSIDNLRYVFQHPNVRGRFWFEERIPTAVRVEVESNRYLLVNNAERGGLKLEAANEVLAQLRARAAEVERLQRRLGPQMISGPNQKIRVLLTSPNPAATVDDEREVVLDFMRAILSLVSKRRLGQQSSSGSNTRRRQGATDATGVTPAPVAASMSNIDAGQGAMSMHVDDAPVVRDDDDMMSGAAEGKEVLRLHLSRERSKDLRAAKVAQVLVETPALLCEVCSFNFATAFPGIGTGFCEVHHLKPVASLTAADCHVTLTDLAIVCPNCHRMLHKKSPPFTIDELKKLRS